jgi:UDP-N-acetylglucosamine 2-epimerase
MSALNGRRRGATAKTNGNGLPRRKTKVLVVIGTRPEAIKMVPVLRALDAHPAIEPRTCVTAQHREMLDQMLNTFGLRPDYDLDVMVHGQSTTQIARAVMDGVESVIGRERPDWVLVQGDTTTAMAAGIAAFHENVHVGHVEAGLRTGHLHSPFPEEGNRKLAAAISELHFAPTEMSAENLLREGIADKAVIVTGNTVVDALHETRTLPFDPDAAGLEGLVTDDQTRLVLVTAHRRENFGTPIEEICRALRAVAERHQDAQFICPVHLNPTVRAPFFTILAGLDNVHLLPPLNYRAMVWVLDECHFVVTDSGGLQEEAASLNKPVLVLRRSTERQEGIRSGVAKLVGTSSARVHDEIDALLSEPETYDAMASCPNPYGDGRAGERIAAALAAHRLSALERDGELAQADNGSATPFPPAQTPDAAQTLV